MELILIIVLFILAILYGLELLKNVKLEKERDIETFEKNKWEMKLKQRESYIEKLREQFNQEREQLNSNADYTMTLITEKAKLKEKLVNKNIMYVRALNNNNYKKKRITFLEKEVARLTGSKGIFRGRNLK